MLDSFGIGITQIGIIGNPVVRKRLHITGHPKLPHGRRLLLRRENGNLTMSLLNQIIRHLIAFRHIVHSHMGIFCGILVTVNGPDRTQNERNAYFIYLPFRVIIIKSQENDSFQPLFLNQLQRYCNLIFLIIYLLQNHCPLMPFELKVQDLDNIVKQRIGHSPHQYGNSVRFDSL